MIKSSIKTYSDLENEKLRLQLALDYHRNQIRKDIDNLREELKPVRNALGFIGKFATNGKNNVLVRAGIDLFGDVVLKNMLFARSGFLTRHIAPFVIRSFSSNLLAKTGGNILEMIGDKLHTFRNRIRNKS